MRCFYEEKKAELERFQSLKGDSATHQEGLEGDSATHQEGDLEDPTMALATEAAPLPFANYSPPQARDLQRKIVPSLGSDVTRLDRLSGALIRDFDNLKDAVIKLSEKAEARVSFMENKYLMMEKKFRELSDQVVEAQRAASGVSALLDSFPQLDLDITKSM